MRSTSRCFNAVLVCMAFSSMFIGFFSTPQLARLSRWRVLERPSASAMNAIPAWVKALLEMSKIVRHRLRGTYMQRTRW